MRESKGVLCDFNTFSLDEMCQWQDSTTGFHLAAEYGVLNQLPKDWLVEANLLLRDKQGNAPMHVAAMYGYLNQLPTSLFTDTSTPILSKLLPVWVSDGIS